VNCFFCGEPEIVDLLEIWDDRDFQLETCCERLNEALCDEISRDPAYGRDLLRELGAETILGRRLNPVSLDAGHIQLSFKFEVRKITLADAKQFVLDHHDHNRPPAGWKFGAGLWNGPDLIGVVMVGRPVSRCLDDGSTVEVNRLCIRRDGSPDLTRHACSKLYGWAAREAARRGYERILTYTLETEPGTSPQAAGWTHDHTTKGGSWDTPSRRRETTAPTCRKNRWTKLLIEPRNPEAYHVRPGLTTEDQPTLRGNCL
jgi:hypothetical protein